MKHDLFRWPPTRYGTVRRVVAAAMRNNTLLATKPRSGVYLNVGCGQEMRPGFYNVDYCWWPGIDLCWNLERVEAPLPFHDGSVAGIFTEHCLEHVTFNAALHATKEFHRILTSGGTVRIVVPDGEMFARRYIEGRPMPANGEAKSPIAYTPFWSINRIFYDHGHKFIYDFDTLREVLVQAGFNSVERCGFGQGRDERLLIDRKDREPESLYVETTKA